MSLLSDLKTIVSEIPSELENVVESVWNATLAALKPIMADMLTQFEQDVIANAGNPALLIATAAQIATAAIPKAEAAAITATGTDLLSAALNAITGHPAVVAVNDAVPNPAPVT